MSQVVSERPNGRKRVQTLAPEDDHERTVQSEVYKADIRHILTKYEEVGIVDHLKGVDLAFRDVTEFTDMADAMQQLREAERTFMKLSAPLREVFDNDAARWLDVAHDAEKLEELRPRLEELGVWDKEPEPEGPIQVEVVNPAPTEAE